MLLVYPKWRGLPVIPSRSAMNELRKHYMDLNDVVGVLGLGCDSERKRKEDTCERCLYRRNDVIKVVVVRSYNFSLKTDCWVVKHVGVYRR